MARIRTTKPEFYTSEQVMGLSIAARYAFQGLWVFCDDGGNHPASAKTLKAETFPSDEITAAEVQSLVDEMITQGLVAVYEVAGKQYWHVTGWHHQRIDKPTYKHPKFEEQLQKATGTLVEDSSNPRRVLPPVLEGSGDEGSGKGKDSVPDGTGAADAPPPAPSADRGQSKAADMTTPEQRKAEAWKGAKSLLNAHGMPIAQTGSFLGKLAKDYGEDVLVEVMEEAVVERPAEPSEWIVGACKRRAAGGERRPLRRAQQADFSQVDYGGHGAIPA